MPEPRRPRDEHLDVLVGGSERGPLGMPGRTVPVGRMIPVVALAAALVLAGGVGALVSGAAEQRPARAVPLGALGEPRARVDDGLLLVEVEAVLRTREPVVLRSGTVSGGGLVLLVDPQPYDGGVRQRVLAVLDPRCDAPAVPEDPALEVVIQAQDGGPTTTLRRPIAAGQLATAARTACQPVRAAMRTAPDGALVLSLDLVDNDVATRLVAVRGRGLEVDLAGSSLPERVEQSAGTGQVVSVSARVRVAVTDCSVEVLAPRRLEVEVERPAGRLTLPVGTNPAVVDALDELVRTTCRRERG